MWVANDYKFGDIKQGNYTIRSGDTLWEIAKAHAANVDDIKRLNATKLGRGNNLKVGLVLAIPATNT